MAVKLKFAAAAIASLADPPVAAMLRMEILRDAAFRQANEFGEWRSAGGQNGMTVWG